MTSVGQPILRYIASLTSKPGGVIRTSTVLASTSADHASATWRDSIPLRLVVGPVAVRYVVSDENRIITVTELELSSAVG